MDPSELEMLDKENKLSISIFILKTTFLFLYQFSEFCVDNYILF